MRLRPAVIMSSFALAALALAGCSGEPAPESTPTSSAAAGDLCDVALASDDVSDAVKVEGDAGAQPTLGGEFPLEISAPARSVVSEGDGDKLEEGDWFEYDMAIFDATTGKLGAVGGFDQRLAPIQAVSTTGVGQMLGCATEGTRVAITVPGSEQSSAAVYVLDVNKIVDLPEKAWGEDQEPVEGEPTVKLDKKGAPTITLPDTDAPAETVVTTLKKGDGDVVEAGSDVIVHYTGVKWSDGSVFDSSWERGTPAPFNTAGVVPGFTKAIEGQTIGSQVLVTMPPKDGYGEGEKNADNLVGETLTFVVDILDAGTPVQQIQQ
ncbi:FKBP-type peptidyl-prolyl cis-trans isomerase [Microbacterium sp. NEAU-LLB]|uniref:Peptidyl-prolyl cis-trans isomerase n=2 Tax=Microbacterium stercoris TaxID=2820289 RepID=A0A939QPR8_9MICO|nr:FKBP-type peptidyl-prolyl cis-trans isomerase [Microbacterium stercoris]